MWEPWALVGLLAVALAVLLALVVFRAAPERRVNRLLALVLLLDAIWMATSLAVAPALVSDPSTLVGAFATHFVAGTLLAAAYLAFVGAALDTPLARPLRSRVATGAVLAIGVAAAAVVVGFTERFGGAPSPIDHWFFRTTLRPGPWLPVVQIALAAAFTFCLMASADAWRRARSATSRRRARAYFVAFGIRDLAWIATLLVLATSPPDRFASDRIAWIALMTALAGVAYVPLLAYGILSAQLFDIDLKIKWTISRGTLAAVFLAVFFVTATVASEFLTGTLGYAAGGVVAGLLLFFLAPLQRMAERVSDKAMPGVSDTDEYRLVRKREVYRAAVESALSDGEVTGKERGMLATLQDELGLTAKEALAIEREAQR